MARVIFGCPDSLNRKDTAGAKLKNVRDFHPRRMVVRSIYLRFSALLI
jgi:hypothetical protein